MERRGGGSKIIRRGTYAPWGHIYFQAPIRLSEAHFIFISGSDGTIEGAPRSNVRPREDYCGRASFQCPAPIVLSGARLVPMPGPDSAIGGAPRSTGRPR